MLTGLTTLGLTICGVVWLAFDVVGSRTAFTVALLACAGFVVGLWVVVPYVARRR